MSRSSFFCLKEYNEKNSFAFIHLWFVFLPGGLQQIGTFGARGHCQLYAFGDADLRSVRLQ